MEEKKIHDLKSARSGTRKGFAGGTAAFFLDRDGFISRAEIPAVAGDNNGILEG